VRTLTDAVFAVSRTRIMLLPHGKFLGTAVEGAEMSGLRWRTSTYTSHQVLAKHSHETANFCLVVRGGFIDKRNHVDVALGIGSVVFWAAGLPHAQKFGDRGGTCFNLAFPTNWLRDYNVHLSFGNRHRDVQPRLAALCRDLYRECQYQDQWSALSVEGLALQLVAEFSRSQDSASASDAPTWLKRVREIIDAQLAERWTIARLASEVNVEPARLARAFQRANGVSVVDYLQQKRLELACQALLHSDDSVSAIGIKLGFFDQSHFTRVFRKATGMTPGLYRERRRLAE
jgi:AraC family transcriptional regulator